MTSDPTPHVGDPALGPTANATVDANTGATAGRTADPCRVEWATGRRPAPARGPGPSLLAGRNRRMGSVIKKRRKRMSKKKHRKLLRKTRVQRRKLGK